MATSPRNTSPINTADYLEMLADSPDVRTSIAAVNREKALRMFSPVVISAQVSEIYDFVLARGA